MRIISQIISHVFHPLLLPTYAFALLMWINPYLFANLEPDAKVRIFATLFINTFFFPVFALLLMWKLNFIDSLQLKTQQERHIPFIASSVFYFWTYMVFRQLPVDPMVAEMLLGASLSLFTTFFINIFYKLSVHAVGAGYLLGIMFYLSMVSEYNLMIILVPVIIVAGLVGTARVYLTAHTNNEVYTGYLIGLVCQILAFTVINV